mmetsp:Transcript_12585/g.52742  ORF Transcript_12585/g.52742 Transcript_12585/m.52742 type:complete len:229 (+) Transcript_12585:99-785(+)
MDSTERSSRRHSAPFSAPLARAETFFSLRFRAASFFAFFRKSVNALASLAQNASTSSRVVPSAAAAVKYGTGYASWLAPNPQNVIPPTSWVFPGTTTRVPETARENNIDPKNDTLVFIVLRVGVVGSFASALSFSFSSSSPRPSRRASPLSIRARSRSSAESVTPMLMGFPGVSKSRSPCASAVKRRRSRMYSNASSLFSSFSRHPFLPSDRSVMRTSSAGAMEALPG